MNEPKKSFLSIFGQTFSYHQISNSYNGSRKKCAAKAYVDSDVIYFDCEIYYGPLEKPISHIFSSYSITIF